MRKSNIALFFLVTFVIHGCSDYESPSNCKNDDDCCFKPNPAYFCYDGRCTYNQFVASDYNMYNFRVQHCNGLNAGGGGEGGATGCEPDLPISPDGVFLGVPEFWQQCQSWCWAASIAMVANYYGYNVAECTLANYKSGLDYCCGTYACASPCNQTAMPQEIFYMLNQIGLKGVYRANALSEIELQIELSNGRPVYTMFQGSFTGHAVVVTGFSGVSTSPAYYHVVDPYHGAQDMPYQSILWGPYGEHWSYTIFNLSPYTDGCN
jgi:hypothetical protein